MGWLSDVAAGCAAQLAAAGVGTWDPAGTSGSIVRGALPPDIVPGVGLHTYRVGRDDPANPTTQVRLQLMLRAATIAALDDLDSAAYNALQGLHGVAMGTVVVTDCQSYSAIPMGPDGNGNLERACNYVLDIDLPATALRP